MAGGLCYRPSVAEQNGTGIVEKATLETDVLKRTVQQPPPGQGPFYQDAGLMFVAQRADDSPPWGVNVKFRDRYLRDFFPSESMLASAMGIFAARNSAFSWKLNGPPRKLARLQRILQTAEFGAGWTSLMTKTSIDLYSQDHGAFWEIMRERNSPDAPLIGIAHLDSQRCYPTGIPQTPVLYQDRSGKYHLMPWYSVVQILEMPAPIEAVPGLQLCALSRLLIGAKKARDIATYMGEKVGGRNARAITLVQGVTARSITEAMQTAQVQNDALGLWRLSMPVMVNSVNPEATVDFKTLELAALPDGFEQETEQTQYITLLAMAFGSDYQELAPLSGGNLGTSTQSEILHLKTRGKGPGLYMKIIANILNWQVLPEDCEFEWTEPDIEAQQAEANVSMVRAQTRAVRIASGELNPQVARIIAHESGDLTTEQVDLLTAADEQARIDAIARINAEVTVPGSSPDAAEDIIDSPLKDETVADDEQSAVPKEEPRPPAAPPPPPLPTLKPDEEEEDEEDKKKEVSPARLLVEDEITGVIADAFDGLFSRVKQRVAS